MTAYCIDTSGSTSKDQALAAVAWIRGRLEPGDFVIVFSYGAEVTTLEEIEAAYAPDHVVTRGPAWFGGTDLGDLVKLVESLRVGSTVVISDGYFDRKYRSMFSKLVDIARLPEVHPCPEI